MRIISGKHRNKKLFFSKNLKTRPLKDNVRENIFNILMHSKSFEVKIQKSYILDLYAGSGSFGLECLSREASKVYFVEKDKDAIINLKKNIKNLKFENRSMIFEDDVFKYAKNIKSKKEFNIVFLDPPYKDEKYIDIIQILKNKNVFNENHIVIAHREKNSDLKINRYLNIIEKRIYGRSEVFFGRFF